MELIKPVLATVSAAQVRGKSSSNLFVPHATLPKSERERLTLDEEDSNPPLHRRFIMESRGGISVEQPSTSMSMSRHTRSDIAR